VVDPRLKADQLRLRADAVQVHAHPAQAFDTVNWIVVIAAPPANAAWAFIPQTINRKNLIFSAQQRLHH
jgi:hypothetical protein